MRTCFSPECFENNEGARTSSFLLNMFQDDRHLKILSEFLLVMELKFTYRALAVIQGCFAGLLWCCQCINLSPGSFAGTWLRVG